MLIADSYAVHSIYSRLSRPYIVSSLPAVELDAVKRSFPVNRGAVRERRRISMRAMIDAVASTQSAASCRVAVRRR